MTTITKTAKNVSPTAIASAPASMAEEIATVKALAKAVRPTAIASALAKATKAKVEQVTASKAGNADEAKAREKAHAIAMKSAAKAANPRIMQGAAVTAYELDESSKLAGKAKVTWYDAITSAFKARAWQGLTSADYDTFARGMISDGVALAFASQAPGNHKVYRSEAKVIAIATANGIASKGKSYNERVQALRDACKAKGLLGEHKNDKKPGQRVPRVKGSGKAGDVQAAADAHAKAGEVKTFDRPLTERMLAMTPIGEYAAFLVSMCLDEAPKVRAWLDTMKD